MRYFTYFTYSISQFRLATFLALKSHPWLLPGMLTMQDYTTGRRKVSCGKPNEETQKGRETMHAFHPGGRKLWKSPVHAG